MLDLVYSIILWSMGDTFRFRFHQKYCLSFVNIFLFVFGQSDDNRLCVWEHCETAHTRWINNNCTHEHDNIVGRVRRNLHYLAWVQCTCAERSTNWVNVDVELSIMNFFLLSLSIVNFRQILLQWRCFVDRNAEKYKCARQWFEVPWARIFHKIETELRVSEYDKPI